MIIKHLLIIKYWPFASTFITHQEYSKWWNFSSWDRKVQTFMGAQIFYEWQITSVGQGLLFVDTYV